MVNTIGNIDGVIHLAAQASVPISISEFKKSSTSNLLGTINILDFCISNIMIFNPLTKKGDRVGFKKLDTGKRVRVFRSNNEVIDI